MNDKSGEFSFIIVHSVPCDRIESGWTTPDRSGEKVRSTCHQTGLLRRWGLLLTRPVCWEGEVYLSTDRSGEKVMPTSHQTEWERMFFSLFSRGRNGLMSLATPSDGRRRSGSGETQARPGATVKMIDKHALVHYLNEKRLMLAGPNDNLLT